MNLDEISLSIIPIWFCCTWSLLHSGCG